mmetsp:Transcript_4673/g.9240  ORF Transcript_4673/g.9240 Transcript_4673/m.9240 type:complete len:204 (+) Transcript_4673:254-865(+)
MHSAREAGDGRSVRHYQAFPGQQLAQDAQRGTRTGNVGPDALLARQAAPDDCVQAQGPHACKDQHTTRREAACAPQQVLQIHRHPRAPRPAAENLLAAAQDTVVVPHHAHREPDAPRAAPPLGEAPGLVSRGKFIHVRGIRCLHCGVLRLPEPRAGRLLGPRRRAGQHAPRPRRQQAPARPCSVDWRLPCPLRQGGFSPRGPL